MSTAVEFKIGDVVQVKPSGYSKAAKMIAGRTGRITRLTNIWMTLDISPLDHRDSPMAIWNSEVELVTFSDIDWEYI